MWQRCKPFDEPGAVDLAHLYGRANPGVVDLEDRSVRHDCVESGLFELLVDFDASAGVREDLSSVGHSAQ